MQSAKIKVLTVVGTRPEIIRLAAVVQHLDKYFDHKLVHTGQNYDYELNGIFFDELGLRKPDWYLAVDTSSPGHVLGETLIRMEEVLQQEKPDAMLLLGDTNAAIAGIMARRMNIPLYHMEAGNRAFDDAVPEELNRRMIDHIANFNLVYTEHSRRNLLREGLLPRNIYLTGSPLREVLNMYKDQIERSSVLERLELAGGKYFLASFHRAENVDPPEKLREIIRFLNNLAERYDLPVILTLHPRTGKRLEALGENIFAPQVRVSRPFGFFDYVKLQKNARLVISDSGTVAEESAMLNFPAITVRQAMERPEAMDCGSVLLAPVDSAAIMTGCELVMEQFYAPDYKMSVPIEYTISDTSLRVARLIAGTVKLSKQWSCE